MIPSKLFIPTSTLNFNSIMSSESISPARFYSLRGFGYKRFEKVAPNSLDNRLILYEKYPEFDIIEQDLENYPMVIEIDTKSISEEVIQEQNSSFISEETIYLNPFSTRIYFRSEKEKVSTLSKAEPSIETKMISLYDNCFFVKSTSTESLIWTKLEIEDSRMEISQYISKDRRINKLKGFLYAYLIASNKSTSSEIVSLKKFTKDLRNVLSAIITSPNGQPTFQQDAQLKLLQKTINDIFFKAQGLSAKLESTIKQKAETYNCPNFIDIIKKENLYEYWFQMQNIKPTFQLSPFFVGLKSTSDIREKGFDTYMSQLESQILNLKLGQRESKIDTSKLPILQFGKIIEVPDQKKFIIRLFNEYLEEAYNSEEFIHSRYEFAKSGGKIFKEEIKHKWDGSQWQQYINSLLKNLNEYSPFNIKSVNNLTLESFAAFCQKGDSDIDKLEDYLISNEIGDFRVAFSLWGIIFGFSSMPKTLTNDLFLSDDLNYISEVYKYIYKQLHGIMIDGFLENRGHEKFAIYPLKINEPIPDVPKQLSRNDDKDVSSELNFLEIRHKLMTIKLKSEQIESIYEIYKRNHYLINDKFFLEIKKVKGIGDKTIEKIREVLQLKARSNNVTNLDTLALFHEDKPEVGTEFFKDSNAWEYIIELLPADKKVQKQVREDFEWFQKNHNEFYLDKKKGQQRGFYFDKQKDNKSTLDRFKKYLENKHTGNQPWLRNIYSQISIDRIITELNSLYF